MIRMEAKYVYIYMIRCCCLCLYLCFCCFKMLLAADYLLLVVFT